MSRICSNCGRSVEDDYKFCSNCGSEIENKIKNYVIICSNCGSESLQNETFCAECGTKLNNNETKSSSSSRQLDPEIKSDGTELTDELHEHNTQNKKKGKTVEETSHHQAEEKEGKNLSKGKVLAVFVGALSLILVILFSEGMFEQTVTPTNSVPSPGIPQINLGNIQEINELAVQVKANPNNLELLLKLADLRFDSDFFQEAIKNYQSYIDKKPNDVDARLDMGISYFNIKNFTKAIEEMEKAIKIKPDHQVGLLDLGIVNLTAGNFKKSKEWLQKAIKVDPNSQYAKKAKELLNVHKND